MLQIGKKGGDEFLALFFTHSGAIGFKRFMEKRDKECELMPVPRKLSSSCGICAKFEAQDIEQYIDYNVEKMYKIMDSGDYKLIYTDDR